MVDSNVTTATISSLLEEFKDFNTLEEFAFELTRRIIVALLEAIDNTLLAAKPEGYKVAGFRLRTIASVLGDITFKRRLYTCRNACISPRYVPAGNPSRRAEGGRY